jgi:hypothetical protein
VHVAVCEQSFTTHERSFIRSSCKMLTFALWRLREVAICLRDCALEIVVRSSRFPAFGASGRCARGPSRRGSCCLKCPFHGLNKF